MLLTALHHQPPTTRAPGARRQANLVRPRPAPRRQQVTQAAGGSTGEVRLDWDTIAPGVMQMIGASKASQERLAEGDAEGAKRALQEGVSTILAKYGERALCIEELYVKLFMLHFQDAQYQEALQDALNALNVGQRAHSAEGSEVAFHTMRLGIAMLACGDAADALPRLAQASSALDQALARQKAALVQKLEEGREAPRADDLESYRTLSAACGEARYYFALCALRLGAAAGGDIPAEEWEAAEGTLVQGMQEMALAFQGHNDDVLHSALREHKRLAEAAGRGGEFGAVADRLEAQQGRLQQSIQDVYAFLEAQAAEDSAAAEG